MTPFEIRPYDRSMQHDWDTFVENSKNGTFLHMRGYMEYHSDRFPDCSLVIMRDNKLYALLPATFREDTVYSHAGLTYGSFILNSKATAAEVLEIAEIVCRHFRDKGMNRFIYKPVPHIYHRLPSEEDLYALFRLGATLEARSVSSSIYQDNRLKFRDIRKSGIRRAKRLGIIVSETCDYIPFWKVLEDCLRDCHETSPVHSVEEITRLASLFPGNIRLHTATLDGRTIAGVLMYLSPHVAHAQYIAASPEGKESGALDLLFSTLINEIYSEIPVFDFGISCEDGGKILNTNLIYQKEGFGARSTVYDTYSIDLTAIPI